MAAAVLSTGIGLRKREVERRALHGGGFYPEPPAVPLDRAGIPPFWEVRNLRVKGDASQLVEHSVYTLL